MVKEISRIFLSPKYKQRRIILHCLPIFLLAKNLPPALSLSKEREPDEYGEDMKAR